MRIMTYLFLCCLLGSCGKTGPLYLPTDENVADKETTLNNASQ